MEQIKQLTIVGISMNLAILMNFGMTQNSISKYIIAKLTKLGSNPLNLPESEWLHRSKERRVKEWKGDS